MPVCDQCGEEIEFRYKNGRPTKMHVNGGWRCGSEQNKLHGSARWFAKSENFVDPNAYCPVCGAKVFYYENSSGSRVFFNDLGWPWPKHGCTDNPASQSGTIKPTTISGRIRRSAFANEITLFELVECEESNGIFSAKFQNIAKCLITYTLHLPVADLKTQDWTEKDFRDAPSFFVRRFPDQIFVKFMSVRKSVIGRIFVPRATTVKSFRTTTNVRIYSHSIVISRSRIPRDAAFGA